MTSSFLEQLSQPQPDPGGGAAAAYGGMLALALLEKVAQLEAQRPANQGDRQVWEEKLEQLKQLSEDLDRLREEDVRAYAQMAQVRASGCQGPEWQEAIKYALEVPQEIMARAREALGLVAWAGARCRKHLVSDLQVAREFLGAALLGAYHIAWANLPLVEDESRRQDFSQQLVQAETQGRQAFREAGATLAARGFAK
ncbi:MAG: cyclodeaminase/cyclohydrolase family protein [Deltaproteobacteria bacterium]|nr:cyclodeaminase/cyclohydrolase family protein [Deltaproteobacteria bacterium]